MTELTNIKESLRRRQETDYIMPIWLPFLPLILMLIGFFGMVASTVGRSEAAFLGSFILIIVFGLIGVIINLYVIYKWISRRNDHFKRTIVLHESFVDYLKKLSSKKDIDISGILANARRDIREARSEESEKNSVLYLVIYLVFPLFLIYIYHFLNKDFIKHCRRERNIIAEFNNALDKLGVERELSNFSRNYEFPDRSTIIYIVLTIVTFGLFNLYWIYTVTEDPNEHFRQHERIERDMEDVLGNIE